MLGKDKENEMSDTQIARHALAAYEGKEWAIIATFMVGRVRLSRVQNVSLSLRPQQQIYQSLNFTGIRRLWEQRCKSLNL